MAVKWGRFGSQKDVDGAGPLPDPCLDNGRVLVVSYSTAQSRYRTAPRYSFCDWYFINRAYCSGILFVPSPIRKGSVPLLSPQVPNVTRPSGGLLGSLYSQLGRHSLFGSFSDDGPPPLDPYEAVRHGGTVGGGPVLALPGGPSLRRQHRSLPLGGRTAAGNMQTTASDCRLE